MAHNTVSIYIKYTYVCVKCYGNRKDLTITSNGHIYIYVIGILLQQYLTTYYL